jgi:hypothetical protein
MRRHRLLMGKRSTIPARADRRLGAWSGCLGCDRDPDFGVPSVFGLAGLAAEASGLFEDGEGTFDLAAFLVAAEHVGDLGAGDSGGAFFGGGPDLVGGWVAEAVAEDPAGGLGAVAPQGERGFEVRQPDVGFAVKGGVDRGEADDVRFGAAGRGAEQALLAA